MSKAKLSWSIQSTSEKLITADFIVNQMTANVAIYATPLPTLADVHTAIIKLRNASTAAKAGGTVLTMDKNDAEKELDRLISALMSYVNSASLGLASNILKSGMEVKKHQSPTPDPAQVINVSAIPSIKSGAIELNWDTLEYAIAYQVDMWIEATEENQDGYWSKISLPSKSKYSVENLTTGTIYKFRIAALGTRNRMGAFSQDAQSVAT